VVDAADKVVGPLSTLSSGIVLPYTDTDGTEYFLRLAIGPTGFIRSANPVSLDSAYSDAACTTPISFMLASSLPPMPAPTTPAYIVGNRLTFVAKGTVSTISVYYNHPLWGCYGYSPQALFVASVVDRDISVLGFAEPFRVVR
jgi:hypothetical protein